ncbi:MAG: hypothetical protein KDC46_14000 [Thermoleophilia bacterium]|nr:hypothetical protein [Thermoleophilia bacterium]
MNRAAAVVVVALSWLATIGAASAIAASPPAACNGVPQVTDPVGDGHHTGTDVTAAWLSEAGGSLQAVIRVRYGTWRPEHEDEPITGSEYALVFSVDGVRRYVRLSAPLTGPLVYDYGTWVGGGSFSSMGTTTGSVTPGVEQAAVIDVPTSALGIAPGTRLGQPIALTIDGRAANGDPHWVDKAPGGTDPSDTAVGADYVVGSCGGGTGTTGGDGGGTVATTTAVEVTAPSVIVGGGMARVGGTVLPAREGVVVHVTISPAGGAAGRERSFSVVTGSDGSFAARVQVLETSRVRAVAETIGSQTATVTVRSRIRVTRRRTSAGVELVRVQTWPALPGKLLLLEASSVEPSATRITRLTRRTATFVIAVRRAARSRYQIVFVPSSDRAERSVSRSFLLAPTWRPRTRSH